MRVSLFLDLLVETIYFLLRKQLIFIVNNRKHYIHRFQENTQFVGRTTYKWIKPRLTLSLWKAATFSAYVFRINNEVGTAVF